MRDWRGCRGGLGVALVVLALPKLTTRLAAIERPKYRSNPVALSGPEGLPPTVSWISFDGTPIGSGSQLPRAGRVRFG